MSKKKDDYVIELEEFKDTVSDMMSDDDTIRIGLLQYMSFRKGFRHFLIEPILGKDYYNLAMDTYNCDLFTCMDIKQEFDRLRSSRNGYALATTLLLIVNILLWIVK